MKIIAHLVFNQTLKPQLKDQKMCHIKLILVSICLLFVVPFQAFADEKNDKAVAEFNLITIPNIVAMAPFISKSVEERKAAFSDIVAKRSACFDAAGSAIYGGDGLALDTAKLCVAMSSWLQNSVTYACLQIQPPEDRAFLTSSSDRRVQSKFDKANIRQIYDEFQNTTGCKDKDVEYWSKKIITDYKLMESLIDGVEKTNFSTITPQIKELYDDCYAANKLRGKYSIVAEATAYGCDAINYYVTGSDACFSLFSARYNGVRAAANDPLADELLWLRASFHQLTARTNCEASVQSNFAKWGTPQQVVIEDPNVQGRIDARMEVYLSEFKLFQDDLRKGEEYEARFDLSDRVDRVCTLYKGAQRHAYEAQIAARDINVLRSNQDNKIRFDSMKSIMEESNTRVKNWCS